MIVDSVYIKLHNGQEYELHTAVTELVKIRTLIDTFLFENLDIKEEEIIEINIKVI